MAARFAEWTKRPGTFRLVVAFLCLAALVLGFAGVTRYLGRPDDGAALAAATVAPMSSPAATPASGPIVVHATGDVNLDPGQLQLLGSGYEEPWTGVRDLFRADDVTVINLECAASSKGSKVPDKQFNFRCPRGFEAMRNSGVEVANQGNNHSLDFGAAAAMDARVQLSRAGVAPVGTGRDADEAHEPAILHVRGKTVAVLGFGGVIPFRGWVAGPNHPGIADGDDIPSMVAAVKAADKVAELVFVAIHWGAERETKPQAGDVDRAHAMIDAGADGIFGHHAHRIQPLEFYKGRPIFYGLGNFVWPTGGETAVAEVIVPESGPIVACLLPGRITGGRPTLTDPSKQCS